MYLPTPPCWTEQPGDQTIELGNLFWYDLNATAPSPITWWVNDSLHFAFISDGILVLWNNSYETYGLEIVVSNIYGFSIIAEITVRVIEHIPPSWMITPDDHTLEYGEPFETLIAAVDNVGIATWTLNDTIHFSLDSSDFNKGSTARIYNSTFLTPRDYGLNITVYDSSSNRLSAIFTVSVKPQIQDTTPPEWIVAPTDQTISFGEFLVLQLAVWDESGIDYWWSNDTTHFVVNEFGLIRNNTVLLSGIYSLNVTVSDTYGNSVSAVFTITVTPPPQDLTAPIWIVTPVNIVIEQGESFMQRLGAWDSSGVNHWWLNDSTYFTMDELGVIRNATTLEPGVYRIEVRVYDPYDNYCSAILVVTVLEAPLTTTTTTTTTDTNTTTSEGVDPVMTLVLGTGIVSAAVVVIVIVFLRRKS